MEAILLFFLVLLQLASYAQGAPVDVLNTEAEMLAGATISGSAPEEIEECTDRHRDCDGFADGNQCELNPGWMIMNCPVTCGACHLRTREARCQWENMNMSADPVYMPGELTKMFESIIDRFEDRYVVNVLSVYPYVVTFDNFLSNDEIRALTNTVKGWQRSTDSGDINSLGISGAKLSEGRTSSTSWCDSECENNQFVDSAYAKIEEVVNVPRSHYESFQVLRYEIGQKYDAHHDFGAAEKTSSAGPRILTFFLYLSDVEEGGETQFPALGISVKPRKGRALLWPSVLDGDYMERDGRTMHEARPVVQGRKFAANTWIHSHNFQEASRWGCAGGANLLDPAMVHAGIREGFIET